jgi:hypothetical protein
MSESLDGLRVAATRQNGRAAVIDWPRPEAASPPGEKGPAGTSCAAVIVAFGTASAVSDSQDPAASMVG